MSVLPKDTITVLLAGVLGGVHLIGCQAGPTSVDGLEPAYSAGDLQRSGWATAFLVANMQGGQVLAFSREGLPFGPVVDTESLSGRFRPFRPSSVAVHEDRLLVTQFSTGELLAFRVADGQFDGIVFENSPEANAPRMEEPCMLRVMGGETWVLGNDTENILVLDDQGAVLNEIGRGPAYMRKPHGFDVTSDGLLYVALSPSTPGRGLIQSWDVSLGRPVGEFAPHGEVEDGTSVTVMPDETVIVADWFGNQVLRYDRHTGENIEVVLDASDGLEQPISVTVGGDETLYILDGAGVIRLDDTGSKRIVDGKHQGLDWARGITAVKW